MDKLIQPRLEVERKKTLENVRKESTEAAINQVRTKIKEQMEAEQAAKEAAEGELSNFTVFSLSDGSQLLISSVSNV